MYIKASQLRSIKALDIFIDKEWRNVCHATRIFAGSRTLQREEEREQAAEIGSGATEAEVDNGAAEADVNNGVVEA